MRNSVALVMVLLVACTTGAPKDKFETAWDESQRNEKRTVDGSRYVQSMVAWLGPAMTDSTAGCKNVPNEPEQKSALIITLLNIDGTVREAMVRPSNPRWECIRDSLARKRFPAPPRDAFWLGGSVRLE